jgi:hypothetical protein
MLLVGLIGFVATLSISDPRNDIQSYSCNYATIKPTIDGDWNSKAWKQALSSQVFIDIQGTSFPKPRYQTSFKALYDEDYLYILGKMQEEHIWTTMNVKNTKLYKQNAFEIFIDPEGDSQNYYEFEINALDTIWELSLTKPYSENGVAKDPDNIIELFHKVFINGTLNDDSDIDIGWDVEVWIPLDGLKRFNNGNKPVKDDVWNVNFQRAQYPFVDGVRSSNVTFWVWSNPDGKTMHKPANWGRLHFL